MTDIIILPGIGGSGESHWQTLWETTDPRMRRFQPSDWERPDLEDWITALEREVGRSASPPVLVAHSLACLLVAHWQKVSALPVTGAFLVSVPDPRSEAFPQDAQEFAGPPAGKLRMPSLIVASSDDPFGTIDYQKEQAEVWGSGIVEIGAAGHVNGQSGLGEWPHGRNLLTAFTVGLATPRR
ncbi:RBBP9/YdeN family alpha/beta hydrolase [Rhizobium herbae]|uniref:Alpha/beta hydrolase family esterase n=1 Tax=Rhizobium herbae TaxID=508661 RepID=A0ABS4EPF9_9HYPH|nr:alpha/beta fold hydrolase [Rhizobium herbae]MBP1859701.1 putative alpha/beta hydrolase family esterase [Rhizobium herbae]